MLRSWLNMKRYRDKNAPSGVFSGSARCSFTKKVLRQSMVVVALITVIVITYLNQKETEPIEQNTVKFEELQKDERISDSNAVESGPVS